MRFQSPRYRGMSLLEVLISMTVLSMLIVSVMSLFIAILRLEKNNRSLILHAMAAQKVQATMRQWGSTAFQFVTDDGLSVRIVHPNRTVSLLNYEDMDGNWETIDDNRITFTPNLDNPEGLRVLATGVTPVNAVADGGSSPIFTRLTDDAFSPLRVRYVLGDYSRDRNARCHSVTGPGFQSLRVETAVSPRNTAQGT